MTAEIKEKLSEIISQMVLLTAACEGNMYHERTVTNEAIYQSAVEIQLKLTCLQLHRIVPIPNRFVIQEHI